MFPRFGVWSVLLCAALPLHTLACDACGCSAAGPATLGLLPATRGHFAGLSFQQQSFKTATADQAYTTVQAWGRASLSKRWQLYGFVPYRLNRIQQDATRTHLSGIGDVSVLLQAVVFRRDADSGAPQQVLLAGAGFKAPTGRHLSETDLSRQALPNSQPGTGAWDGQLAASYTLTGIRAGFNAEASYVLTTPNADDYKYGNRLGTSVTAFLRRRTGTVEWLPIAGGRFEYLLHNYTRYSRRWLNRQTGGSVVYAQAGVQAYLGRLGVSVLWSQPVYQAASGDLHTGSRLDGSLTFFF
ncbi:MAG: hypothetical protein EOP52_07915 [Sphingobacteriales bacterium]|nr:MAG: hypothetical protein EOP52_07915 [Sphingobacteriales bacterium]